MKKLKTILHTKKYGIVLIIFILLSLVITKYISFNSKYNGNETYIEGYVISKSIKEDKTTITLKGKEKIIIYYNGNLKDIELHDYVGIYGNIYEPSRNTIFNTFNYKEYLYNNQIYYLFNGDSIKIINNNSNIFYKIKNMIDKRLDNYNSKDYLRAFLTGNKTYITEEEKELFNNMGIIHLLSISGMHISIFIMIIDKLFGKNKYKNIVIIIFLLFYIFITNYQVSILRCFLCYLLKFINSKKNYNLSRIDILFLACILLLIRNPFYIYNTGFLLSFIITYSIIKTNKSNYIKISIISFFSSIPIVINTKYSINFLSIITNIIFIPFVTFILYPLSLITFIFPFFDKVFSFFIDIFIYALDLISNIDLFTFSFSKIPIVLIFIYYYFLFSNKKKYLIILFILFYINNYYLFKTVIYYIDVGQGDSSLMRINNKNILIDTGGKVSNNRTIKSMILFFKSIGIKKIDCLIITHGDYDHMGEAINLVNNFKVEKVIFNCGEFNDLEQKLIKVLNKKRIPYYSCIKELNIDKNKLYFLQTKEYDNENDNSNIIYTELNGYKFMFMGDASTITEKEILDKYNLSNIDVLKVGHHGSKTSSGKEFISEINPKYSIISVGKKNRYGHPNKEVLENLEDSKIYRTDEDGSIMFKIKNNKLKIEACSP